MLGRSETVLSVARIATVPWGTNVRNAPATRRTDGECNSMTIPPGTGVEAVPRPATADHVRTIVMGAAAAGMILVPTLGPVIAGTGEGAEAFDTEITPPDYAFVIWAPIFGAIGANAVQHAVNPAALVNRRTGWWLAGAYGANAAWSIAAQANRFRYTPRILPVAAGLAAVAYQRAQHDNTRGAGHLVAHSTGLLFGWTSLASVVNVVATWRRGAPATRTAARLAVAGAAAAVSATIALSRHGHVSVAVASTWALATSAANPERAGRTRRISAAGAALIAGTTGVRTWQLARRR